MESSPCLICYSARTRNKNNVVPSTSTSTLLQSQLVPLFLLKRVLKVSNELCVDLLSKHGNPSEWAVEVCSGCQNLVAEAQHIFNQISYLMRKLKTLKAQCETKIVMSTAMSLKSANKKKKPSKTNTTSSTGGKNPVDLIRDEIVQRCRVTAAAAKEVSAETPSIKIDVVEDDDGISDYESSCFFVHDDSPAEDADDDDIFVPVQKESSKQAKHKNEKCKREKQNEGMRSKSSFTPSVQRPTRKSSGKINVCGAVDDRELESSPTAIDKRSTGLISAAKIVLEDPRDSSSKNLAEASSSQSVEDIDKRCRELQKEIESMEACVPKIVSVHVSHNPDPQGTSSNQKETVMGMEIDPEDDKQEALEIIVHSADDDPVKVSSSSPVSPVKTEVEESPPLSEEASIAAGDGGDVEDDAMSCGSGPKDDEPYHTDHDSSSNSNGSSSESDPESSFTSSKNKKSRIARVKRTCGRGYECTKCSKKSKSKLVLFNHNREVHNIFICIVDSCEETFSTWALLLPHFKSQHPEDVHPCEECPTPTPFRSSHQLAVHRHRHHGDILPYGSSWIRRKNVGPLKCPDCDRTFLGNSNLATHRRLVHSGEQTCKYCQEKFSSLPHLMLHLKSSHVHEKDHMCEYCSKTFAYPTRLIMHQYREHDVPVPQGMATPWRRCPECNKVMSHIRALERHLDTVHRKIEKSIKCPKEGCKYVTNSVYILQSHIKYMHDKVPRPKKTRHECPECGKKLAGIASRNRHLKFVHGRTDVKVNIYNYPCPKCDKVTMSKRWLLSHLVHKHGEKHVITRCPSELKPRSNKNKKIKRKMKKKKKEERDENDDNDEQEENDDNDEQEESKVAVANLLSNEVVLGL